MASGRFISSSLGDSEKFSGLSDPRYQVAYVLLVTWADAEGRFIADPVTLNGKLFTRMGWTPDMVCAALRELHEAELITLYRVDGKPYGVIEKFHEHNTITRKEDGRPAREAVSRIPSPEEPRQELLTSDQSPCVSESRSVEQLHEPVQEVRSPRAEAAPEVEVQVQHQLQHQGNTISSENAKSSSGRTLAATPPRESHDPGQFAEVWNKHRGRLPSVTSLNAKRKGQIKALVKEHGPDAAVDLFRDAVQAVAADDFWVARQYGFDTLMTGNKVLARAEQWRAGAVKLGEGNLRLAANVERWSKALPEAADA